MDYSTDNFKRKIRFISGAREYSHVEDFTEYLSTLVQCNNKYEDTKEVMTKENCNRFIKPCTIKASEIDKYNGVHAAYGMLEIFSQSYGGGIWLNDCNEKDELLIVFETID